MTSRRARRCAASWATSPAPLGLRRLPRRARTGPRVHLGGPRQPAARADASTAIRRSSTSPSIRSSGRSTRSMPPVKALGYNGMWPGPLLRVTEGDKVRVNVTNNLDETTGVHFHGVEFDDFRRTASRSSPSCPSSPARRSPTSSWPTRARTCTTRTTTRPTRSAVVCWARSSSIRRTRPSATPPSTA